MSDISEDAQLIQITLNGKPNEIKAGMTVSELLLKWKIRPELVTVEINETILQKLDYDATRIKAGDHVEFVFYMGGGSVVSRTDPLGHKDFSPRLRRGSK